MRAGLHFRRALLGGVVPRAARLITSSLIGRLGHVSSSSEGWAREGECQNQRKRRNERFHGHTPWFVRGRRNNSGLPRRVPLRPLGSATFRTVEKPNLG